MWFKVDDKLHDHRKVRAAGATAMGVWVLAGSWSADNLTDGFIPAAILPRFGRQREANRLVEVGLWFPDVQDGETGWRFHEWEERQPTRAQKEAERRAKAEAGRIGGLHSGRSRRGAKTKQGASGLVELPSRPVPSRPDQKKEEPAGSSSATPRKRPSTRLAEDWKPTESHWERRHDGIDVQREADTFRAHAEANDRRCVNWNAAFTQWLLKARPSQRAADQPSRTQQHLALAKQLHEEEQGQTIPFPQIGEGR